MDGYYELCNMIIKQAVDDYREAKRNFSKEEKTIQYLEEFFKSKSFETLSDLDEQLILQRSKNVMKEHAKNNWEMNNMIIKQSIDDYIEAKRNLSKAKKTIQEIENFFKSEYFQVFSDIDGPTLLRRVNKLIEMG